MSACKIRVATHAAHCRTVLAASRPPRLRRAACHPGHSAPESAGSLPVFPVVPVIPVFPVFPVFPV
jgi:hypothetical protein